MIFSQDREMIERHITQELKLYFPMQIEYVLRDPLLFGDCRNAINANNQKRIYEDLIDYDSAFYLFQEVSIINNFQFSILRQCWLKRMLKLFEKCLAGIIRV